MSQQPIVEIKDLSFSYPGAKSPVIKNVSMRIPQGAIYGFLGVNGAGKSTMMQLLTASLIPEKSVDLQLFGTPLEQQVPEVFKKMGCLIEAPALYTHLTARENLQVVASLKDSAPTEVVSVLQRVGLEAKADQKVSEFSMGMKQRLGIAMALLGSPELLILDEPLNSLDPQGVIDIRTLLRTLNEEGVTIVISSHLLDEIEKICTHLGVLDKGALVFEGSLNELQRQFQQHFDLRIETQPHAYWYQWISEHFPGIPVEIEASALLVSPASQEQQNALLIALLKAGAVIEKLTTHKSLEHLFLNLTQ